MKARSRVRFGLGLCETPVLDLSRCVRIQVPVQKFPQQRERTRLRAVSDVLRLMAGVFTQPLSRHIFLSSHHPQGRRYPLVAAVFKVACSAEFGLGGDGAEPLLDIPG